MGDLDCGPSLSETKLHQDNAIKAINEALGLREEVDGPLPKSGTFCFYYAEKTHYKQNKNAKEEQDDHNESSAKRKRKIKKQNSMK